MKKEKDRIQEARSPTGKMEKDFKDDRSRKGVSKVGKNHRLSNVLECIERDFLFLAEFRDAVVAICI